MSKCDFCQFKKAYARLDFHWLGEDDCPLDCPFEYETKYTDAVYDDPSKYAKQTNANRIRAMSDEELAKFLQEDVFYEPWCPDDVVCILGEGCQLTDKDCGKCALKWLKQEAKDG